MNILVQQLEQEHLQSILQTKKEKTEEAQRIKEEKKQKKEKDKKEKDKKEKIGIEYKTLPAISVGDLVKVGLLIREGDKERVQTYEGTVISQHKAGLNSTMTVRKSFQGVGIERVFFLHSPRMVFVDCLRHSKVRRAKLYYLRSRLGKQSRLQERF
jgi:large subunit ribosomal protein L19